MIIVVSGPGGVGKGTLVDALLERDDQITLSRSWTTRARRPGERADAYVFVDRATFEARIADDGFLEWAEFIGNLYGSPRPESTGAGSPGATGSGDLLLEIDVQGAAQVLEAEPDALLIFVDTPDREQQRARLEGRGDPDEQVAERLAKGDEERAMGRALGAVWLINDDLARSVDELDQVIEQARDARR